MDFCSYYEQLLSSGMSILDYSPEEPKYEPILDDPIHPHEVDLCIKRLKANKAAGVDGVPPGLLKLLDDSWIINITLMFNYIFENRYPVLWSCAKFFNIFKKGHRLLPQNYRGISILVALAKLYDMVLSKRFQLWYKPSYEQAGAQQGRGCNEQIFTVRLLIDIARKRKLTLYITFVDFQKAYDKVDRLKLLQYLDRCGCGSKFIDAIKASYVSTRGQIGLSSFTADTGVRQGACTSCPFFTFFVDPIVAAIKTSGPDAWLHELHTLLLMDDTIVLATSRQKMEEKLLLLKQSADSIGMAINSSKTQFLVVGCDDDVPFTLDNITVSRTDKYSYLGTWISNTQISNQVKEHIKTKNSHCLKFAAFLSKNSDAPYTVKKKVWESALMSAVFYSCESWLTRDLKAAEVVYTRTLKHLMSVRITTCTDLVMLESGECGAKALIRTRQRKFLDQLINRNTYSGSYLETVIDLAKQARCSAGLVLAELTTDVARDYKAESCEQWRQSVQSAETTRRKAYRAFNPTLSRSPAYTDPSILEHERKSFTRMRLSSHELSFEKGRWSRIPPEERVCPCGAVQTDSHVLLHCPKTQRIRDYCDISVVSISELFTLTDTKTLCNLCCEVLKVYS